MLKGPVGLTGLTAQPQKISSAAQRQECKFFGASLKKGGVAFFARRGVYLASKETSLSRLGTFLATRAKNCIKRAHICPCVGTLKRTVRYEYATYHIFLV